MVRLRSLPVPVAFLVLPVSAAAQAQCSGNRGGDGAVTVDEIIAAGSNALHGCSAATPTATATAMIFRVSAEMGPEKNVFAIGTVPPAGTFHVEAVFAVDSLARC